MGFSGPDPQHTWRSPATSPVTHRAPGFNGKKNRIDGQTICKILVDDIFLRPPIHNDIRGRAIDGSVQLLVEWNHLY